MADIVLNHVKKYRLEKGITQDEVARAVGVSRQSINSIEREKYIPSLPLALRFSKYFMVPIETLFQLKEDRHG